MNANLFPVENDSFNSYLYFKRLIDIVLSFLVIVLIIWWIIPLLSILVLIDSKGPVFHIQRGRGRYFKKICFIQFRTVHYSLPGKVPTPVGNFLMKTGLHVLPQFFNVLAGNMSLVGPAPVMKSDDERFSAKIKGYFLRYNMKPGLTGMAQIKGYSALRGSDTTIEEFAGIFHRYQWDTFYIRNAHFLMDMRILAKSTRLMITTLFTKEKQWPEPGAVPMIKVFQAQKGAGAWNN